jgi:hypothetical protein
MVTVTFVVSISGFGKRVSLAGFPDPPDFSGIAN